jgi:hypothetical protein
MYIFIEGGPPTQKLKNLNFRPKIGDKVLLSQGISF